jgi:hypothetical protein
MRRLSQRSRIYRGNGIPESSNNFLVVERGDFEFGEVGSASICGKAVSFGGSTLETQGLLRGMWKPVDFGWRGAKGLLN